MVLGIDPKVDYAFKRVFGDERNADILIHLLNAILRLREPIVAVEVLNPFNDKDFVDDKLSVLDIRARDQAGRLLDVEMQVLLPPDFCPRILYYWAGIYRKQLSEGADYDTLRPAISVCLLDQVMFPDVEDCHLAFVLLDRDRGVCFTDHIQIHLLELPKFQRQLDELRDDQERWLYFFRHAEMMDVGQLPRPFREPAYQRAFKELEMLTQDELERERYEARLRALRDERSRLRGAEERGEYIGRIHSCERFLKRPITPRQELAELSLDRLRQRAEQLEAEAFGS